MNDLIKKIKNGNNIPKIIQYVVHDIYENGPINSTSMEILCYSNFPHQKLLRNLEK